MHLTLLIYAARILVDNFKDNTMLSPPTIIRSNSGQNASILPVQLSSKRAFQTIFLTHTMKLPRATSLLEYSAERYFASS